MSGPGPSPAEGRDAGLQPERTRLAWRRTTLACSVTAVLALRQALRGSGSPVEVAGAAVIVLLWLVFLGVAHRRIRALAAHRPPRLAPRAAAGATLCTLALAAFAVAVIL
ncbi:DUF202 domain-containing protein [Streptomyces sp. NPDC060334]|uniref:DUF202 domain-containing protein n=1 Tax=unclassified Streptomyces TaxID=2593676 RepID=UPI0006B0511A|nr:MULTISPECIES: DUF202 domain-containing protein [unclassified Streptomyces]MCX5076262.1 DUF202 domain-containing protein [Streptomyces sp. NBC_00424]MCX5156302.1 DUF202 domain-containing protein [Streptomyces sp. NBC_00291]WUD40693.1 DUF202 domain-containing protein [Streptomyces sp. NBC_00513]